MITGHTKTLGLIGNPTAHTKSPILHNKMAEIAGIDCVYTAFCVRETDLRAAILGAHALGVWGLNVTVPYKTAVMEFLEDIEESARRIGAVNTLKYTNTGYIGYNTDIDGLESALLAHGCPVFDQDVVIIGAGGAARAAAHMAAENKAKSIAVINRDLKKADRLCAELDDYGGNLTALALDDYQKLYVRQKQYIAIQTTSVGMEPHEGNVIIADRDWYQCLYAAYDCVYKPEETLFMRYAKEAGATAHNGLTMLLYQAVRAFEVINDVTIKKEDIDELLYPLLT